MKPGGLKSLVASRRTTLVCLLLVLGTLAVYWQVSRFEFVSYDDSEYVYGNPVVRSGLTLPGAAWAFSTWHTGNWHPLTWLSHLLACDLFGLNAGAHHLANVGLHIASALLLFLVLRRMTGALWRSAIVAVLFAWHPLHVESVAWVAERKDVLSGFFFMLTLWAYVRYVEVRRPKPITEGTPGCAVPSSRFEVQRSMFNVRSSPPSSVFYLLALVFFACGLMSKPMLVTLPFVLLLLDFWPLQRYLLAPLNLKPSARKFHPSSFAS